MALQAGSPREPTEVCEAGPWFSNYVTVAEITSHFIQVIMPVYEDQVEI